MARFRVGEKVRVTFNPPKPDLRVANQVNGVAPGRGEYQTEPTLGTIVEIHDGATTNYLVDVELSAEHERGGKVYSVKSVRKRVIAENKLEAL